MKQKIRQRLAGLAIAGLVLGGGGAVATSVAVPDVAQAFSTSSTSYCPWPQKSGVVYSNTRAQGTTVYAYSHSGAYLGSRSFASYVTRPSWTTPWEDVRFTIQYTYSGSVVSVSTYCSW